MLNLNNLGGKMCLIVMKIVMEVIMHFLFFMQIDFGVKHNMFLTGFMSFTHILVFISLPRCVLSEFFIAPVCGERFMSDVKLC